MNPQGDNRWACGRCKACRINRKRNWTSRLLLEYAASSFSFYVTLTFRLVEVTDEGVPTLNPLHLREFFRDLRKRLGDIKVRYFACGEYGGKTSRPHYHLLLFFSDYSIESYCRAYLAIPLTWRAGYVNFGNVCTETIGYVVGYLNKGRYFKKYFSDGRYSEFPRFSQGLGKAALPYFLDTAIDEFPREFILFGRAWPVPRYFREKAKALGYEVNKTKSEKKFLELLSVQPHPRSIEDIKAREKVIARSRAAIYEERQEIENRRARSTALLKRGLTERGRKNETF